MRCKWIVIFAFLFLLSACQAPGAGQTPALETSSAPATQPAVITPTPIPTQPPPVTKTPAPTPAAATAAPTEPEPTISPVPALAFPDPAGYLWQPLSSGLNTPIGIFNAGDGSQRLFIIEQKGLIRILKDGQLALQPFLDIQERIESGGFELGLLGLVFHPRYVENGLFYVNYTDLGGDTVIARFQVSAESPDLADPASELILLQVKQPYENHNGGGMAFGPDGFLYLGLGDGGSAGDPQGNAQNLTNLLGKLLRIDVDGAEPYVIPSDNPFAQQGGMPEIWAYGLRNPWRFSFDRLTGDLYIGDVGQSAWEEINFLPAGDRGGVNFGWDFMEGNHAYEGTAPASLPLTGPVAEYSHDLGCSVTGGVVYRGSALPAWYGIYLFSDFCSGNIWGLYRDAAGAWQQALLYMSLGRITSFGEDEAGEVYAADHNGVIYRLEGK